MHHSSPSTLAILICNRALQLPSRFTSITLCPSLSLRSTPFVRLPSFDSLRSTPFVRLPSFDSLRPTPFDTASTIPYAHSARSLHTSLQPSPSLLPDL